MYSEFQKPGLFLHLQFHGDRFRDKLIGQTADSLGKHLKEFLELRFTPAYYISVPRLALTPPANTAPLVCGLCAPGACCAALMLWALPSWGLEGCWGLVWYIAGLKPGSWSLGKERYYGKGSQNGRAESVQKKMPWQNPVNRGWDPSMNQEVRGQLSWDMLLAL